MGDEADFRNHAYVKKLEELASPKKKPDDLSSQDTDLRRRPKLLDKLQETVSDPFEEAKTTLGESCKKIPTLLK